MRINASVHFGFAYLIIYNSFNSFINMSTPLQYKPAGGYGEREEIMF